MDYIPSNAQNSSSLDATLSLLRGTWAYDTFDKRIIIEFISDNEVYIDDTLRNYSITNDAFTVEIDNEEFVYHYKLSANILSVTDPDGEVESYEHKGSGYNEKYLSGSFLAFIDSTSDSYILFKKGYQFQLSVSENTTSTVRQTRKGYFRIEGNDIYLAFFDGTVETAYVRYRDEEDSITGVMYKRILYDKQYPDILIFPSPAFPPPEIPPSDPWPPIPDNPVTTPLPGKITDPKTKPSTGDKKRDDGSKRDGETTKSPGKKRS
jgi:hypothetical protein